MYVLDTNVISEMRRPKPHGGVLAWLSAVEADALCLSAATVGELQAGVERTRKSDPAKADEIEEWVEDIMAALHILALDGSVMRLWARLMVGRTESFDKDMMIAATALVYGMPVVTRNVKDFFGVPGLEIFNPFAFGA